METEKIYNLLDEAIFNMRLAMPLLKKLNGKIPTEILNQLDDINKLSVKY